MNAAQQLTIALRGITTPPIVKSGIDHLRALTDIFNATKEGYDDLEEKKTHQDNSALTEGAQG